MHASVFRYFEWSFMISMIEKINRLKIKDCKQQLEDMKQKLTRHRTEFMNSPEILDFEKMWVEKYL